MFQRFCLRFANFNARLVFTHLQGGNFGALDEAVVNLVQFGLRCGGLVFLQFDAGRGRFVKDVGAHGEVHGGIVGVRLRFESDDRVTRALCHFQRRLDAFQFTRLGAVAGVRPRVFFADAVFVEQVGDWHIGERVFQLGFGHGWIDVTREAAQGEAKGAFVTDDGFLHLDTARVGLGKFGAAAGVVFKDDAQLFDDVFVTGEVFFRHFQRFA